MKQLYTKDGVRIIGTKEIINGTALVSGFDGHGQPIYAGGTDIDWDSQLSATDDKGKYVLICEDGEEHSPDDCELRD
ncbi:hypothetical protein [Burkholderia multivorans]|uniref:hypothetical protein n=1 Tax=Burkholderia multivorans TaxID=87883 RepID=UPI00158E86A7|nr:hypothetical protein [Burkholderia multivorans]MDR8876584.1 hypothetical protein [Burkholderia multivorans]MDR8882387.1 hypothetical protein [Burkholderia multivorans]MDR8888747.1 hypothetical protein [Burkholderia multivorans]MDR8895948.1 hypothetical protein [Burkholderia multivorans]MDR8901975.1 hypothetical protein [Burkholderia multivorans]